MSLTLAELCNAALEEVGFSTPSAYASGTDPDAKQVFRLANRQGFDLSQQPVVWEGLKTLETITLVAGTQAYDLPSDYRYMVPGTEWDQNNENRVLGPQSPRLWAEYEYGGDVFGLNWRYEIRNGQVVFNQTVESGDAGTVISYDYVSKNWARDVSDTPIERFAMDTDYQVFDGDLFSEGLLWRWKKAKGFDWQEDFTFYTRHLESYKSRDGGMEDVFFGERTFLGVNVPESGYGAAV